MKTSQLILSSSDGSTVYISRAAASLSDVLHRHIDDDSKITITNANGVTLRCLVSAAESIANRVAPGAADPLAAVVECTLRTLSLPQQLDVLRTALKLKFHSVARLAAMPLTALLKGRSTEVLRVALDAPDDLTVEEKRIALAEPLLTPPDWLHDNIEDDDEEDDDAMIAHCLADLDARSLKALKGVSKAWLRRARRTLGVSTSAWRSSPEWSAGAWASKWFNERLHSEDMTLRKRALLGLDALEPIVELPFYLDALIKCLKEERSSHRALALRALARLEPLTLTMNGVDALTEGLSMLEPHEADSEAAKLVKEKLEMGKEALLEAMGKDCHYLLGGKEECYLDALAAGGLSASLSGSRKKNKREREAPAKVVDLREKLSRKRVCV